jgi:hypothetical protein
MAASTKKELLLLTVLSTLLLVAAGCNSSTDDPDVSDSIVSMASADPTEACVDYDGEEDEAGVIVFSGVTQAITLESRLRGTDPPAVWQDVVLSQVRISYDMTVDGAVPAPAPQVKAMQGTVPAGGTLEYPMVTVEAVDVADGRFERGDQGRIVLEFSGEDVSGKPVTATGNIRLFTASECGTGGGS